MSKFNKIKSVKTALQATDGKYTINFVINHKKKQITLLNDELKQNFIFQSDIKENTFKRWKAILKLMELVVKFGEETLLWE